MAELTSAGPPACAERWWELADYQQGELVLPGPSRLSPVDRKVLEDLATRANHGNLEIPPMPKAAMAAMKLLRSAEADIPEVAKTIQTDPVLTALVLKHANSALYGPRSVIDTVSAAVSFVGLHKMKDLVIGAAMRRVTNDLRARAYAEMEWKYAIACASIAKLLGKHFRVDQEQCYVAGLLHDIGRLPVLMALDSKNLLPTPPKPDSAADIILEALHRGVGLQVVKQWEQPPSVCDAVTRHLTGRQAGEESSSEFPSTRIAEASGDLCVALGLGRHKRPFNILESQSFRELGFTKASLSEWLEAELPKALDAISAMG